MQGQQQLQRQQLLSRVVLHLLLRLRCTAQCSSPGQQAVALGCTQGPPVLLSHVPFSQVCAWKCATEYDAAGEPSLTYSHRIVGAVLQPLLVAFWAVSFGLAMPHHRKPL